MPTRYTKGSELQQFQYEIANEIRRDAKPIADGVFGNNARHPDMASISNEEMDRLYREAYLRNDRKFLAQEAQRDPQQFLAVTDRLGVTDPPIDPKTGNPIQPPEQQDALAGTLQQAAMQNAAQAQPVPVPSPVQPPMAAPAVLPPPAPSIAPVPPQLPLPGMAP